MNLRVAFSTCPNDTFMFDAMINYRIDSEGHKFHPELTDIEKLNQLALQGDIDILKVSYAAYPQLSHNYQILNSGSALGHSNGPLLVSKRKIYPDEIEDLHIAIPGANTTANLLLTIAYPKVKKKTEYLFSDIEEVVLSNETDAGLLIHENLGTWWEQQTSLPIPLGGIMVKRSLPKHIKESISRVLSNSVSFAMEYPLVSLPYIRKYAQSMKDDIIHKHIELYVNQYSVDLGEKGRQAIETLFEKASENKKALHLTQPIFAIQL
jgi:1,4-dihydroxy-6-naphthoate synthase